jgi:CDP-paratose 2-epimerase
MATVIVTGSAGLIGAETVRRFCSDGYTVAGIDNDMRAVFFGPEASTKWAAKALREQYAAYRHHDADIREFDAVRRVFDEYRGEIVLVVHTAAQPSHDWAARDPVTDFDVNARGTLGVLEAARACCPEAPFIFTSTNKVYGDTPNALPMEERESRWEVGASHPFAAHGIDETMSIDAALHSVFGASKVAADVMVQEYGRYFGMKTACFRGGCLTGPGHSGAELHGFLAYLMKCAVENKPYTIYGYKGKQVRDNIHAADLVSAFVAFFREPRAGAVYNIGGGRHVNCSVLEAIARCEALTGRAMTYTLVDEARRGDHIWWISDARRFQREYPEWRYEYDLDGLFKAIYEGVVERV